MKITESFLKKIIKEEKTKILEGLTQAQKDAINARSDANFGDADNFFKALEFFSLPTGNYLGNTSSVIEKAYADAQANKPISQAVQNAIKSLGGTIPTSIATASAPANPAPATVAAATAQPAPVAKPAFAPNSKVKTKSGKSFTFIRSQGNVAYITDGSSNYKVNLASLTPELQENKIFKMSYVEKVIKEETQKYLQEMKIKFKKGSLDELDMNRLKDIGAGTLKTAAGVFTANPSLIGSGMQDLTGKQGSSAVTPSTTTQSPKKSIADLRASDDTSSNPYGGRKPLVDPKYDNQPEAPAAIPYEPPYPNSPLGPIVPPKSAYKRQSDGSFKFDPSYTTELPKPTPKPVAPKRVAPKQPPDEYFEPENYVQVQGKGKLKFKPKAQ